MLSYSGRLAVLSLRRNAILNALMFAAVGIGIGGSMSTYTIYYAMAGDPIPWKSSQLFTPQIDSWGPLGRDRNGEPPDQLGYQDAIALLRAHVAHRAAAMYRARLTYVPTSENQAPVILNVRATSADFFAMFDTPFAQGGAWTTTDDDARANVVVLGAKLAGKLFPGRNPVGQTITFDDKDYRIVGVLKPWNPAPRFYELGHNALADSEDVFLPFNTAVDRQMPSNGHTGCNHDPAPGSGWTGFLSSDCTWIQYWVQLPTAADVQHYRQFLDHYVSEQQRLGRFTWPPLVRLRDVRQWLAYKRVVSDELRATTLLGFGFLGVCLINAVGLMLAKFSSHNAELAVRRALGASRAHLFVQCLAETAVIGAVGGLVGLALALAGVAGERAILPGQLSRAANVDIHLVALTLVLAIVATLCAGVYPAWRVSRTQPAWQLKAQ